MPPKAIYVGGLGTTGFTCGYFRQLAACPTIGGTGVFDPQAGGSLSSR